MAEGGRLSLQIDMSNDDGWNAGGPWIKPAQAMQQLVWSEARTTGPRKFTGALAQPQTNLDFYRDIAAIAFPSPAGNVGAPAPSAGPPGGAYQQTAFSEPFRARSVVITATEKLRPAVCELQASDDGLNFQTVRRFDTGWGSGIATFTSITLALPETVGRLFRVYGFRFDGKPATRFSFTLSETARVDLWEMKAGFVYIHEHGAGSHMFLPSGETGTELPSAAAVQRARVLDLSASMDASGRLDWDVPEGDWTILRIGYTPSGAVNGPATPEGKGLDCDAQPRRH